VAVYFFDTSALVKRHVLEVGSSWVESITDPAARHTIFIARITGVEMIAAITKRVRKGEIMKPDGDQAILNFQDDFARQYNLIEVTDQIISQAMTLTEKYPLRGYDAVQLSAAIEVHKQSIASGMPVAGGPAMIFVSADQGLNRATSAEGLAVEDPTSYP